MGGLLRRQRQIAAKIEATEGSAETLAAADANLLVYDPSVSDDVAMFERDPARSSLSPLVEIPGIRTRKFTFAVDLKGSSAIATAPSYGKLLKACGMGEFAVSRLTVGVITGGPFLDGETITGGTSAATAKVVKQTANGITTLLIRSISGTFSAGSETITGARSGATATETGGATANQGFAYVCDSTAANIPSLTIGSYEDGKRKLAVGCRGNVKLNMNNGEPARLNFEFSGVYSSTTDLALLTGITFESTVPEPYLSAALVLGSFSPIFTAVEFDIGNNVAMRQNANAPSGLISAIITKRKPVGTIDPETELVGTKDFYSEWLNKTVQYFETTIGSASGNKITLIAPALQLLSVSDGDRDGIALDSLSVGFKSPSTGSAGDDEFTILCQ